MISSLPMKKNKVTIALIAANRPNELIKCLKSVIAQEYKEFDLIVSDDSVTLSQNDKKRIEKLAKKKGTYSHNVPPLGEIPNSNRTISAAKTEYVCLLHDDDRLEKDYLNRIIKELEKNPSIDLAYTGRVIVDHNDKSIAMHHSDNIDDIEIYKASDILDNFLYNTELQRYVIPINTPGLVFRKSIFEEIGGFSEEIDTHCDTDFLLKALYRSKSVLLINEPLYISKVWYGNSGRTSSSRRGVVWSAQKSVYINFINFAKSYRDKKITKRKDEILLALAKRSVDINGPLVWIALRYQGSLKSKYKHLISTYREISKYELTYFEKIKLALIYISTLLIPQFLWLFFLKIFLFKYNEKN